MAILAVLGLLVALLLFVRWDRRRIAREATLATKPLAVIRPELDSARMGSRICVGVAAVFGLLAANEWTSPSPRPYRGRWSWLKELAFQILGPAGPALLWAAAAVFLLLLARSIWRHTMKRPSDRWL